MAKFIAKCQNQILTIKPKRVQFIEGIAQITEGHHIRFENGEFETSDKTETAYIRKHRLFGNQIVEVSETDIDPNDKT